jgi:hypothetical protein
MICASPTEQHSIASIPKNNHFAVVFRRKTFIVQIGRQQLSVPAGHIQAQADSSLVPVGEELFSLPSRKKGSHLAEHYYQ